MDPVTIGVLLAVAVFAAGGVHGLARKGASLGRAVAGDSLTSDGPAGGRKAGKSKAAKAAQEAAADAQAERAARPRRRVAFKAARGVGAAVGDTMAGLKAGLAERTDPPPRHVGPHWWNHVSAGWGHLWATGAAAAEAARESVEALADQRRARRAGDLGDVNVVDADIVDAEVVEDPQAETYPNGQRVPTVGGAPIGFHRWDPNLGRGVPVHPDDVPDSWAKQQTADWYPGAVGGLREEDGGPPRCYWHEDRPSVGRIHPVGSGGPPATRLNACQSCYDHIKAGWAEWRATSARLAAEERAKGSAEALGHGSVHVPDGRFDTVDGTIITRCVECGLELKFTGSGDTPTNIPTDWQALPPPPVEVRGDTARPEAGRITTTTNSEPTAPAGGGATETHAGGNSMSVDTHIENTTVEAGGASIRRFIAASTGLANWSGNAITVFEGRGEHGDVVVGELNATAQVLRSRVTELEQNQAAATDMDQETQSLIGQQIEEASNAAAAAEEGAKYVAEAIETARSAVSERMGALKSVAEATANHIETGHGHREEAIKTGTVAAARSIEIYEGE